MPLIASDIKFADASQVFTWRDRGRALAAATQSEDPKQRRPLEQVSKTWQAPTPETLSERAERLGWITARGVRSPAPRRARSYVRHGMSMETHARKQRERQIKARRPDLDRIVERVLRQVPDDTAVRYLIDCFRTHLAKRAKGTRGRPPKADQHDQWARDVRRFKGNALALAKHWGIRKRAAQYRISAINRRLIALEQAS